MNKRKSKLRRFATGSTRSADADGERYDLITPHGLKRLAAVYAEGAAIHGPRNWERGQPVDVVLNHALRHLNLWRAGDRSEDHIAKAAWGLFAILHFEETKPELFEKKEGVNR